MGKTNVQQQTDNETFWKKNALPSGIEATGELSDDMCFFQHQVAGHADDGKCLGIIKYKKTLLKPIRKQRHLEREVQFYKNMQRLSDNCDCNHDAMIKNLVPGYFGQFSMPIDARFVNCVMLEDLTSGMREPCIMDVKIGKRTWDPEASFEKIQNENAKYKETKCAYGLCVPGFQVYDVRSGTLRKFDKLYGKQLNKDTVIDAFRIFLNGSNMRIDRMLLVKLLVDLWCIQNWARKQSKHRLYSSSILLIYDARRLRQTMDIRSTNAAKKSAFTRTNSLYRPMSVTMLNDNCNVTGFSGQIGKDGPILPCLMKRTRQVQENTRKTASSLRRIHSFQHNYDEDLRHIRSDYASLLDDLVEDGRNELWAIARMIDFAHAFPADRSNAIDCNYLQGIKSLVTIFEDFLTEVDTCVN